MSMPIWKDYVNQNTPPIAIFTRPDGNLVGTYMFMDMSTPGWHTYRFEVQISSSNHVSNVDANISIINFKK